MTRWLVGMALGVTAAGAMAQPARQDVPDIVRKAVRVANHLRYSGTRIVEFRRGPKVDSHREYITRDGDRLRIEFPGDSPLSGQIIVEANDERRHFFPDRNEIQVLPPRREEAFERLGRMLRDRFGFKFVIGGNDTVAGRSSDVVSVTDPSGNVMQKMYIDSATGLVLKRDFFDPVGTRVGGYEFVDIDYRPRIDGYLFRIVRRGARVVTPAQLLEELAKKEGFRPYSLPATDGVRLEWSAVWPMEGESVLTQSYTTTQGRLTLFQLRKIVSADKLRSVARGRAKFVFWRRDGRTFVLVGNRSTEELSRLAAPIAAGTVTEGG